MGIWNSEYTTSNTKISWIRHMIAESPERNVNLIETYTSMSTTASSDAIMVVRVSSRPTDAPTLSTDNMSLSFSEYLSIRVVVTLLRASLSSERVWIMTCVPPSDLRTDETTSSSNCASTSSRTSSSSKLVPRSTMNSVPPTKSRSILNPRMTNERTPAAMTTASTIYVTRGLFTKLKPPAFFSCAASALREINNDILPSVISAT